MRTEAADAYAAAWGETQSFTTADFGAYVQDGWSFLLLPQGDGVDATLLHAPTGLTEFNEHTLDGILPDGAVLTTIDKYAFEGCENMTLAVLPGERHRGERLCVLGLYQSGGHLPCRQGQYHRV